MKIKKIQNIHICNSLISILQILNFNLLNSNQGPIDLYIIL